LKMDMVHSMHGLLTQAPIKFSQLVSSLLKPTKSGITVLDVVLGLENQPGSFVQTVVNH
jgi:hypothetical protein